MRSRYADGDTDEEDPGYEERRGGAEGFSEDREGELRDEHEDPEAAEGQDGGVASMDCIEHESARRRGRRQRRDHGRVGGEDLRTDENADRSEDQRRRAGGKHTEVSGAEDGDTHDPDRRTDEDRRRVGNHVRDGVDRYHEERPYGDDEFERVASPEPEQATDDRSEDGSGDGDALVVPSHNLGCHLSGE